MGVLVADERPVEHSNFPWDQVAKIYVFIWEAWSVHQVIWMQQIVLEQALQADQKGVACKRRKTLVR
jgi:hypothetical protein